MRFDRGWCLLAMVALCSTSGERRREDPIVPGDPDSGSITPPASDAAPSLFDGNLPPIDPFDPESACGAAIVPSERVPGSLLLVFDKSTSMEDAPDGGSGGTSKWELAEDAINSVLGGVSDDLEVGLLLFPHGEPVCDVTLGGDVPQVDVAPLSMTRSQIQTALASGPDGSQTPILSALRAGYDYVATLTTTGQRGVVLVTDGAENCDSDQDEVLAAAATHFADDGWLTFAVGLNQSDAFLSTLATNGGTRRSESCIPQCTSPLCMSATDCPGSAPCVNPVPLPGIPGFCGCVTDADCPMPLSCGVIPFLGRQCTGTPNCCHYDASASSFRTDFEAALAEIARRFLDSCVFELPRDPDEPFDPFLVNVGVTFEGEERSVLPQSDDESRDSWNFTTPDHESIVIQGETCERLLMEAATVEIVLGCPTIVI